MDSVALHRPHHVIVFLLKSDFQKRSPNRGLGPLSPEAIAISLEAIEPRLDAIARRLKAIPIALEALIPTSLPNHGAEAPW